MSDRAGVPPASAGLTRGMLITLGVSLAVITIAGVKEIASILAPTLLALVLAVAVQPLARVLRRHRWPGWLATTITILAAWGILAALALSVAYCGVKFAALIPQYSDDFSSLVKDVQDWMKSAGVGSDQASNITSKLDPSKLAGFVASLLSAVLSAASNLFLIGALLLFFVADGTGFAARLSGLRPQRPQVVVALESFAHGTRQYLVVTTVFGLIVAVIDTGVLWVMDVPEPILWGLLAFITNYIPNIGFVIGLVPPAILALLDSGVDKMIAVIVAYCLINVVIQTFIQPRVIGDTVGMSASLTFVSLIFWAWVLGPLGALLAIPVSLLAKALLIDVDPAAQWVRPLVSGSDELQSPLPGEDSAKNDDAGTDDAADGAPGKRAKPRHAGA
ncbi:AI-2E family transporter [Nocardioides taihuensis]|uniref:AI-2E family transporter n=1 Tax=Nocardioides taihuensis TaxID=1835606 RepID=A0ABW0BIR1_9ACTN